MDEGFNSVPGTVFAGEIGEVSILVLVDEGFNSILTFHLVPATIIAYK